MVGPRLRHNVHLGATRHTEPGVIDAGLHLEFLDGIERRRSGEGPEGKRSVAHAVQQEAVHVLAQSVGVDGPAAAIIQFGSLDPRHDSRGEKQGLEEIAPIVGKLADLGLLDGGPNRGGLGVQYGRS